MKPLGVRLNDESIKSGIARHIIEKDYILSWVLAGIASIDELNQILSFKGGTCLKKVYFGDYRFSEDADYSVVGICPLDQKLESLMQQAIVSSNQLLSEWVNNAEIVCSRYSEKKPHPEGQKAFVIKARLPYQRDYLVSVLVEVTINEKVVGPMVPRKIIHPYGESINTLVNSYSLEEIIAEKICAILSNTIKIHEKTWHRSRARDYYDIWRIMNDFKNELSPQLLGEILSKKLSSKTLSLKSIEDLFEEHYIREIKNTWKQWLGPLVPGLPSSDQVIDNLRLQLSQNWREIVIIDDT